MSLSGRARPHQAAPGVMHHAQPASVFKRGNMSVEDMSGIWVRRIENIPNTIRAVPEAIRKQK